MYLSSKFKKNTFAELPVLTVYRFTKKTSHDARRRSCQNQPVTSGCGQEVRKIELLWILGANHAPLPWTFCKIETIFSGNST